jgi:hypothetical protein
MDQLDFPFPLDPQDLQTFLSQWLAIEREEDRLREEKRLLRAEYKDQLPLRGLTTAIKVVRARQKLEQHPKEPMTLAHQGHLEAQVEAYLAGHSGARITVPQMTAPTPGG